MLINYLQNTRRITMNDQTFAKVNDYDLQDWINIARGQIAIESECVRCHGTLDVGPTTQEYRFNQISLTTNGFGSVIAVRVINYLVGDGQRQIYPRSWAWFNTYKLSNPAPVREPPNIFSQYSQGANGSIFVNLLDTDYTLSVDATGLPIDLVDDGTVEAIPYPWTVPVMYYAAYMGYMQMPGSEDQAQRMYDTYELFMGRARQGATPSILPANYDQQTDPTLANKLGSQPFRNAADLGAGARGGRTVPSR